MKNSKSNLMMPLVAAAICVTAAPSQSFAVNEPDAYIEYVQSNSKQWVDSGVKPGPAANVTPAITSMIIDADVDIIGGNSDCDLVGVSYNNFEPMKTYNGKYSAYVKNSGETTTGVAINTGRHRVITTAVNGQKLAISVDGVTTTAGSNVATFSNGGNTLYIFARKGPDRYCSAKLWGLKIYINDELVRDFVPGIKNGVAGLYDRQNDGWYTSGSGTALIAGPVFTPTSPTPTEFPTSQQTVTLECATTGATIYYTTDGSDPTTSSTVYTAPFTVTGGTTVKARAYMTGLPESAIFSATFTHVSMMSLAHRWSFTSDYSDSVGNSTGTPIGSALAIENGEVVMSGDGYGTGSLNLGNGVMPSGDATIEIWATRTGVKKWSRIFDIGSSTTEYFTMSWVNDTDGSKEQVILRKNNVSDATANTMLYASDVKYHISVTFKANNDGSTTVSWARRNVETGALEKSGSKTYSEWTLAAIAAGNFYLGHSQWSDNYDANAKYDEVRIWNGALGEDQLAANASMGPDVYTAGLENGFTLADNTVFNIPAEGYAASGIVTLGAGSKLRFDTSSMQWDESVSFSALGFTVPSGEILDYVEPQDSAAFRVTLSGNTITVTRLRQNQPDAYLEYVESDSKQWVDSGVKPGPAANVSPAITSMIVDADVDIIGGNSDCDLVGLSYNNFEPIKTLNGKYSAYVKNSGNTTSGVAINTGRHRVITTAVNGQKLAISVDGVTTTAGSNVATFSNGGNTLYIFARKGPDRYCSAKLWGLKIYINDELVRDFVPGIKNTVAGLYDMLNDVWYVSQSNAELIPGPVKERHNEPQVYIDYVKSTGSQWVDSGVLPGPAGNVTPAITSMIIDADVDITGGNSDCDLVGMGSNNFEPMKTYNGKYSAYVKNSYETTSGVAIDSGRHRVISKAVQGQKLSISVDGVTTTASGNVTANSNYNSTLYLFARHGPDRYCSAKLWGMKIYINNILKRDFVPGIKDDVVGLYDRVSDMFLSSGSGTPLVAGPVVDRSKPDAFVEYVESNGSQWVDTGVDGRAGVKAEADIDWISGNAPLGVIGNTHCLLLQALGTIGGQALGSGEIKTGIALNSGRHLIVSEAPAGSKMTITVDGTTTQSPSNVSASGNTGMTIWMFAAHGSGGKWGEGASKFYELKLWRTGADGVCRIQRHFIPCVKGGRAGLYDAVSGVIFYSHSGTDLVASSTTRTLSVWRNEADDASLDNAANWCGNLPNGTDAVVCAPWVPAVSATDGLAFANLTVSGGDLAFANGTNTVAGALAADGALAFTNLVINGSADCAVAISGFISGHGTVKSLTLAEGARFIPDGDGYLMVSDALVGTMLIDMTGIDLSGVTSRFPLFKTGTAEILPAADAVEFVGGSVPSGRLLLKVSSGFGYDLGSAGFFILLR